MTAETPSAVVAPKRRAVGSLVLPLCALLIAAWLAFTNLFQSVSTLNLQRR